MGAQLNDAPLLLDISRLIWRSWAGRRPTGIDRVCRAYVRHYRDRAQAVVQFRGVGRILSQDGSRRLFTALLSDRISRVRLTIILVAALVAGRGGGQGRPYLNVGHTGLDRPGFRRWLSRADVRPIYLVHDLIPLTHPEYCRPGEYDRHAARVNTILATGKGIIANSRATLDALFTWAATEGTSMPSNLVAWLGHDVPRDYSASPILKRPYFVTVGTIEGRKNHAMLLRVWRAFADRYGDFIPTLLVIGQRGWEASEAFALLDSARTEHGRVIELRDCDDATLARHLRHACALLFPSHAEGYGLPLIEALAAGTPVVASDLPVFRELAGDAARYLDPDDAPAWSRAVREFASVPYDLDARDTSATAFNTPTYAGHFERVDAWLDQLPVR